MPKPGVKCLGKKKPQRRGRKGLKTQFGWPGGGRKKQIKKNTTKPVNGEKVKEAGFPKKKGEKPAGEEVGNINQSRGVLKNDPKTGNTGKTGPIQRTKESTGKQEKVIKTIENHSAKDCRPAPPGEGGGRRSPTPGMAEVSPSATWGDKTKGGTRYGGGGKKLGESIFFFERGGGTVVTVDRKRKSEKTCNQPEPCLKNLKVGGDAVNLDR